MEIKEIAHIWEKNSKDVDKDQLRHLIPGIENVNRKLEYFDCGLYKLKANYSGVSNKMIITL